MKNKDFVKYVILLSGFLLICLSSFNYNFDKLGLFQKKIVLKEAASKLVLGKNIAGLENYDERLLQKYIVDEFQELPDCIIIGSSRTMMTQSSLLSSCKKVQNHSVSGASLEDYMGIVALYVLREYIPKKIILGIDPWVFNQKSGQTRWKSLYYEYTFLNNQFNKEYIESNFFDYTKYLQLINFETTLYNVKYFHEKLTMKTYVVANCDKDLFVKLSDGSVCYPFSVRNRNDIETQKLAKNYISYNVYALEKFNMLYNTKLFEDFIKYLQKQNVNIEIILPPYHPIVYDFFAKEERYKNVLKVEEYLNQVVLKYNIKLYGSYNPEKYNLTSKEFTDGMHGKEQVIQILYTK